MSKSRSNVVQKLWNYCNVLRDDGMSYGDYVEQLTYLLFFKMADERTKARYNQKSPVPEQYGWPSLMKKDGDELFDHYRHTLEALGNQKGLLGLIFKKSQNKFQDPAKLRRLIVDLSDEETWVSMSADVKGRCLRELAGARSAARASRFALPPPSMESCASLRSRHSDFLSTKEPQGHQVWRRPVLGSGILLRATSSSHGVVHAAPVDPGHCRCHGPEARQDRERPGLRHRRSYAGSRRPDGEAQPAIDHDVLDS